MNWVARVAFMSLCVIFLSWGIVSDAAAPASRSRCPLGPKLVPACGSLWGVTPPTASLEGLRRSERAAGRDFDFVYRFHDLNDAVPDADDRAVLAKGLLLHIAIDARDYGRPGAPMAGWADVAAGRYDGSLLAQARGVASIGRPVFVTFDHEPDQPLRSAQGTPADYVAAWQHVYELFEQAHATNAVWVWVVTGWMPSAARALKMWPGNEFVDWISWEAYDFAGCRTGVVDEKLAKSFTDVTMPFYDYLHENAVRAGIDMSKPIMISEAGNALSGNSPVQADWYQQIPRFLRSHPQFKAVGLWDHASQVAACSFRFSDSPMRAADVARAGRAGWVNPLAPS